MEGMHKMCDADITRLGEENRAMIMRIKGIYRQMLYEYWQSLRISNTYQLTPLQREGEPTSLQLMQWFVTEHTTPGSLGMPEMYTELADDFNSGRRV